MKGGAHMAISAEKLKIISFVSLVLLLFSACSESDSKEKNTIIGSWEWYQSSGGYTGGTETPESTGETRKVVFEENGNVTYYTNDTVFLSSTYTILDEETIVVEDYFTYTYSFPYVGELELIEDGYDTYTHNYRRG